MRRWACLLSIAVLALGASPGPRSAAAQVGVKDAPEVTAKKRRAPDPSRERKPVVPRPPSDGPPRTRISTPVRTIGVTVRVEPATPAPTTFALSQNYPNPFNGSTTLVYSLPRATRTSITIYNLTGQRVVTLIDRVQEPGRYTLVWKGDDRNGKALRPGVYLYRMVAGSFTSSRKLIIR